MPGCPRKQMIRDDEVTIVHCINRCVRRAFLCGRDHVTGKDFSHRRSWVEKRLELLAAIFGIDVLNFAVMSNHIHLILRTRPDVVSTWSDREVAKRWWRLFPKRRRKSGAAANPTRRELDLMTSDSGMIDERRRRLGNLSWFMRCVAENIARRANREDGVTGRFWEGRFKSQVLLDEAALLACGVYVDLNPVRARLAETPEGAKFTSVFLRLVDQKSCDSKGDVSRSGQKRCHSKGATKSDPTSWLSPLPIRSPEGNLPAPETATPECRASNDGFLSMSTMEYLAIVEWTSRNLARTDNRDVPDRLEPILERIGCQANQWLECIRDYGQWFYRAVGKPDAISNAASIAGKSCFHGVRRCRQAFIS